MGTFGDLKAQFDPVNKKRKGDQFEFVCKWFLENDPTQYKTLLRRVWPWRDWPGNWGIDAGIDLVAEDNEGRLWAIQAKAYENTVTRSEVNKFLAEASRFDFTHRMLMATTDKLSPTAQRTMEDLGVTFIGLTELEEFEDWPAKLTDLRPAKPSKPKKPWGYQNNAITDVVKGFESADRGQLIMACGTGKTLTAWFIKEKLAAERTLVLVPSLSLLKQTMKEWRTANINRPFDALPVCSDETVRRDEDAAISHTSYLGEPVDTDPEVIAAFLRKRSGPRVVFSTYQSAPQIAEAFKLGRVPAFDLVIADEAHRVAGAVSSEFATILDPDAIRARRRLFMTATPRYYTGRVIREAREADDEIASMDDPSKFGKVFHRLGFSEAIERRLLTDYQVAIIGVDNATYLDWVERGKLIKLNGEKTDARSLAGQIGLAKAMRKYDLRRVISFHGRVNRARSFADSIPAVIEWMPSRQRPTGSLWAAHASGNMSAGQRHNLLQQLKRLDDSERGILANARCLAEGVDVPTLDGVAFIDPRRSEVDIVQAVGRAIRKSDTKSIGTIVVPVFIDMQEDPEVALDDSVFKPVWDVIKALRAHDDELGRQLDELRRELGRQKGRLNLPPRITCDLSQHVSADFARAFDVRLVEQTTASWEFWFGLLQSYVEKQGNAAVATGHIENGLRLGQWTTAQRANFAAGKLDDERRTRLEALPGWAWDLQDLKWERAFQLLSNYAAKQGVASVPKEYVADGYPLGVWTASQRRKRDNLAPDRRERLEVLPGWSWNTLESRWEEGFRQLQQYVRQHGDALVPSDYCSGDFRLGGWVTEQRTRYAQGSISEDRKRRLEALPKWAWNKREAAWEEGIMRLAEYAEAHGSAQVPISKVVDGFALGKWVVIQRSRRAGQMLSPERQKRLEDLPGWTWNKPDSQWEEGYQRLLNYIDKQGDSMVPVLYKVEGFNLGGWVNSQRDRYKEGELTADRSERLQRLPGWSWNPISDSWEASFRALAKFAEKHGHCRVPPDYGEARSNLSSWVMKQRSRHRQGRLDAESQRRLEDLPEWSWDPYAERWETAFELLADYAAAHGEARVPTKYTIGELDLDGWIREQRTRYSRGHLEHERQRRLEELPGWSWNPHAEKWEQGFSRLEGYIEQYGHARVPKTYIVDGFKLGSWVTVQRSKYAKGTLDAQRRRRLETQPGWVWKARI